MRFARELARALIEVGEDAVAAPFGRALPLEPEAYTDPARLMQLIGRAGVSPWPSDALPEAVALTPQEAPSSNCRNSVLALRWRAAGAEDGLPRTLFLKQPSGDRATRVFANLIGFWRTECAVCRNLSKLLPIDSPRIFAVDERRSRFVIAMENLRDRPATRLFINRDLLGGIDAALARRCVTTLARLHAGLEGWTAERREAALPLALHPFLSPTLEPIMLAVNRLAIPRCRARADGELGEAEANLAERALEQWPAMQSAWYSGPLTLVHGDSHIGNFFESRGELGMLDFQGAHWGRGTRDVQYLLVNSMEPELLAKHERSLIGHYAEERRRCGAPIEDELAWSEYRGFVFQTLMTAVVSSGLGSFTDSDAVMQAMLRRSVAAIHRLRFDEWLDEAVSRARSGG
jgi:thiamine kinase-like enzyme